MFVERVRYDQADRLNRIDYPAFTATYVVDELGNRTQETGNFPGSVGLQFNAFNQLTRRRNATGGSNPLADVDTQYAYDNNGNLLSESTSVQGASAVPTTYNWDRDNRLRQVLQGALPVLGQPGGTTSYSYDANGLRINRTDGTGVVNYLLSGLSVLEELNSLGQTTTQLLNHPQNIDDVISFNQSGATYYPLSDALGSVHATSDALGSIVHRYEYDVWGTRTDLGGSGPGVDFGFSGRWHDANGIVDHRTRQRSPRIGAWLQRERLNGVAGRNAYIALDAQPASATDPEGRSSTGDLGSLLGPGIFDRGTQRYEPRLPNGRHFLDGARSELLGTVEGQNLYNKVGRTVKVLAYEWPITKELPTDKGIGQTHIPNANDEVVCALAGDAKKLKELFDVVTQFDPSRFATSSFTRAPGGVYGHELGHVWALSNLGAFEPFSPGSPGKVYVTFDSNGLPASYLTPGLGAYVAAQGCYEEELISMDIDSTRDWSPCTHTEYIMKFNNGQ